MLDAIEQVLVEGGQTGIAVALGASIDCHQHHAFAAEPRIDILQVLQSANEQARAHQEHEGKGDLHTDQRRQ